MRTLALPSPLSPDHLEAYLCLCHLLNSCRSDFGVKLWVVLQDITQLQRHYKDGWETFLGNAGLIQLFANGDEETLRYAAGRMEKLIAPFELRTAFSRERFSQLLLMEGLPPAAALRLDHSDVAMIREHAATALGFPRLS